MQLSDTTYEVSRPARAGGQAGNQPSRFSRVKRPIFFKKIKSSLHVDNANPVVENLNVEPKPAEYGMTAF